MCADNIVVDVIKPVNDEDIEREIVEKAKSGLVGWRDLINICRSRGVSLSRLRKIIASLLSEERLVELQCRLFVAPEYLETTPREILREEIVSKIKELGLRKCGKPVGIPYEKITITISRTGKILVRIS